MLMSMAHVIARDMQMFKIYAAARIHVNVCGAAKGHVWVYGPDAAGGHVDICGLCYHLRLWDCL